MVRFRWFLFSPRGIPFNSALLTSRGLFIFSISLFHTVFFNFPFGGLSYDSTGKGEDKEVWIHRLGRRSRCLTPPLIRGLLQLPFPRLDGSPEGKPLLHHAVQSTTPLPEVLRILFTVTLAVLH